MKAFRFLALFSFVLVCLLGACKKKKEEVPDPAVAIGEKLMAKIWQGDSVKVKAEASLTLPQAINQRLPLTATTLEFKADKTFTAALMGGAGQTGNWELLENGTKIKLTGGFQTAISALLTQILPNLATLLPQGTSIKSIDFPEIWAIKTLTDTNLALKGTTTVNVEVTFGTAKFTVPIPLDTEISFKR